MSKRLDYINDGGTNVSEVSDRKLPASLDPESLRSQQKGWFGQGLNKQTFNESMAELNQGVDITEAE